MPVFVSKVQRMAASPSRKPFCVRLKHSDESEDQKSISSWGGKPGEQHGRICSGEIGVEKGPGLVFFAGRGKYAAEFK